MKIEGNHLNLVRLVTQNGAEMHPPQFETRIYCLYEIFYISFSDIPDAILMDKCKLTPPNFQIAKFQAVLEGETMAKIIS